MIDHGMNVIGKTTELLHPGQVLVLIVNQPLFVIAKKIQET